MEKSSRWIKKRSRSFSKHGMKCIIVMQMVALPQLSEKKITSLVMGCIIDIVIDRHTVFIPDDYQKGVIVHEIVEFTTKGAALKEHKDEIKKV